MRLWLRLGLVRLRLGVLDLIVITLVPVVSG